MTTRPAHITPTRLARLFSRLTRPATASRARERVYALSQRATGEKRQALLGLSYALNEHRHMLVASFLGDIRGTAQHARARNLEAQHVVGQLPAVSL